MNIRKARLEELPDLIKMVSRAFQYKEGNLVNRDFPLLYSPSNINNLLVMEEAGALLAHAGRSEQKLKLEGVILPVSGIGGVCTEHAAQGKGYATKLVEKLLEEAKAAGSALAFLWSDRPEFYQKLGFELVGRQWCLDLQSEPLHKLAAATEVYSFTISSTRNDDFFTQSFSLLSAQDLGVARSFSDHRKLLSSAGCEIFSAWLGSDLMAYMVLNKGRDLQGYIHEWAGEAEALLSLLPHVAKAGAKFLLTPHFTPEEAPWIYRLEELGFPMEAQSMGMVNILNLSMLEEVLQKCAPEFSLTQAEMEMSRSELTQLLFGVEEESELKPLRLWFWGMDSV